MEQIWQWLMALAARWLALKDAVEQATGLPESAIHILGGVLLQLAFALVLRRSLRDPLPWGLLLLLELANEALDLTEDWPGEVGRQIGEGLGDVAATMALPTVLLLVARFSPRLLTGGR